MCLILFGHEAHPRYRLVLAANRDEFHRRPTRPAAFWEDAPDVLAGRDLVGGGTWMGVTRSGRVAAVTNFRRGAPTRDDARSRGVLVGQFLTGEERPEAYARRVHAQGDAFNGFSLIVGDGPELWFCSNAGGGVAPIDPGVHGLSNHLLDTPWPKVQNGRRAVGAALQRDRIEPEPLLELLADRTVAADDALPQTGVGLERERDLSPIFIATPQYGTRSSTVLLIERDGPIRFVERSYSAAGRASGEVRVEFSPEPATAMPRDAV